MGSTRQPADRAPASATATESAENLANPGGSSARNAGASGRSAPEEVAGAEAGRLWVEDGGNRRPFMRGIIIHSLMARGVSFEDADRTANEVRDRVQDRSIVTKAEIVSEVRKILGDTPFEWDYQLPAPADISVKGQGQTQPFSKGVLAQSLLAAAIDPQDAFDVAREIERELRQDRVGEIDRTDLRGLAFKTLSNTIGSRAAERYLVWRKVQQRDRPVILLLGGAAGVGKTSLALEVAHRLGIGRVLSSDSVRQIMRLMLSADLAPAIHGSSYDAYKLLPTVTQGNDPVIEGFRAQTATVSVGVRASMDRAVSENASLVFDGVSIVPGMIDLEAYGELAHVVFLVVANLDTEEYAGRFASREEGQVRRGAHRYVENLDSILKIQDHFLDEAERYGVPIVENDSFDRAVLLIIRHVTEALREQGPGDSEKSI
jgi:2-phosphoglycerate kinase